jgi:protease-4
MSFFKTLLATTLGVFIALFVFVIASVGIVIAIVVSAEKSNQTVSVPTGTVLEVSFAGAIPELPADRRFSAFLDEDISLSLASYLDGLDRVAHDKRVAGLLLNLDKFGGTWAQADEIRAKLEDVKRSGKFIYAVGGVGGYSEKDYYLATVADSIILNPAGELEMNGIFATLAFFKPAMDKLGIEANVVRAGAYKSAVEPFINESASPQNAEMTTSLVNDIFNGFKEKVSASRGLSKDALENILDQHALVTAEEAIKLHLVDAVLYDDQVNDLIRARTNKKEGTKRPTVAFDDYASSGDESDASDRGQIAVVYADGAIASGESGYSPNPLFGGQVIGSETFIKAIREARDARSVKAIVLRINSPGGDAAASEAMWREVTLARQKKPVIVSMGSLAASGGYFIAAAADTIVAEPTTLTGSIGVFGLWFNLQKFYRNTLGVNIQVIKTNPNADMLASAEPPTELEKAIMTKQIDTVYSHFLSVVSQGRRITTDSVNAIAQGRVWTGRQALANGLVDILGGLDKAIEIAAARGGLKKGEYSIRTLPNDQGLFAVFKRVFRSHAQDIFSPTPSIEAFHQTLEALQKRRGIQARMVDISIK